MKIGVLTYHNTLNFGAALQAFSLLQALRKLGSDPEIINYKNAAIETRTSKKVGKLFETPVRTWARTVAIRTVSIPKVKAFSNFSQNHLTISAEVYKSNEEILATPPKYDLYMLGSDQVWNYEINGVDSTFFLDFVKNRDATATYASSFGLNSIPVEYRDFYAKGLSSIKSISVRENLGADLVENLIGKRPAVNPDPVFLTSPQEWRNLARTSKFKVKEDALVGYFLGSDSRKKADSIIHSSKLKDLTEVKLAGGLTPRDFFSARTSINLGRGPAEFVQCIDNASFVITGSFHATAFSIILDKPFAVLLKGDPGKDSRISELLAFFGLEDRAITTAKQLNFNKPSSQIDSSEKLDKLRKDALQSLSALIH